MGTVNMKIVQPIEWNEGRIKFLDQRWLPGREKWRQTDDWRVIARAIKTLAIRGAPLIGIAAALGIAAEAHRKQDSSNLRAIIINAISQMKVVRPTAVNLAWSMNKMSQALTASQVADIPINLEKCALSIWEYEKDCCKKIGEYGSDIISPQARIITICNTGALATGGIGTALGVIYTAVSKGKSVEVFVCETRPLLQGARLTAWELQNAKIPVTLIVDSAMGWLLKSKNIDICLVGADRIAANGDTANKVGSYTLSVLCARHKVPFYVVAPMSTIDPNTTSGADIPIEQRNPKEVLTFHNRQVASSGIKALNPAFDVVSAELITGIITEQGIFYPPYEFRLKS